MVTQADLLSQVYTGEDPNDPFLYWKKPWMRRGMPWEIFPSSGLDMGTIPFGGALTGGISSFPTGATGPTSAQPEQDITATLLKTIIPQLLKVVQNQAIPQNIGTSGGESYASPTYEQYKTIADTIPPGMGTTPNWGMGPTGLEPPLGETNLQYLYGVGGIPPAKAVFPVDEGLPELPSGVSDIEGGAGLMGLGGTVAQSLLKQFLPKSNPALNYIASTLGTLGKGSLFTGGLGGLGTPTSGLGAFMSGQTDYTNPYSGYLESIPLLGSVLGGMLNSLIGKEAPEEPMNREWVAKQQWLGKETLRDRPLYEALSQKYPGFQPPQGSGLYGGNLPISILTDEEINTYKGFGPDLVNELTNLRNTMQSSPGYGMETGMEDWYRNVYAPIVARAYGPFGSVRPPTFPYGEGSGPIWRQTFDPNSPLGKWDEILRARDLRENPEEYEKTGRISELISKAMGGLGEWAPAGGTKYYGSGGGENALMSMGGLTGFFGSDPFEGLTQEERDYFYNTVLPQINQYAGRGWQGSEFFPESMTDPMNVPSAIQENFPSLPNIDQFSGRGPGISYQPAWWGRSNLSP